MMEPDREKLTLTPADAAAMDALLNGEARPEVSPARQQRVEAWLGALEGSPMPEPAGDLAVRTLAAVEADRMNLAQTREAAARERSLEVPARARVPGRWRRKMAEYGAMGVAAALVLWVGFLGFGQVQHSRARTACAGNLKLFANAFNTYSSEAGNGMLPVVALPANGNWLVGDVSATGVAANNAANLMPLVTPMGKAAGNGAGVQSLMPPKALFCPGTNLPDGPVVMTADHMPAIGYSYRDMAVDERPRWVDQTIVLTDKNPVFGAQVRPELADRSSPNHDGKGTYVLRANGSVIWELHPDIGPNRDNIWTISGHERLAYTGTEKPAGLNDVFVCP